MHRLALILLATSACVADGGDEGFEIIHNLAAPDDCVFKPGGAFIPRGVVDKKSPEGYIMAPEFVSRIMLNDASVAQRTIAIRGARVDVTDGATGTSYGKFTSRFAASLSPLGMTTAAFEGITPSVLGAIPVSGTERTLVIAKVTAFGALGGTGDEIDAVPFEFPITVCDGCVAEVVGTCPLPFGTQVIDQGNMCAPFQDGFIQCCSTAQGNVVCPATVSTEPPPA